MRVLGRYKIEYQNGFIQEKYLIDREDFNQVVKSLEVAIGYLEIYKHTEADVSRLKKSIEHLYGSEYFTNASPLFDAIKTRILELPKTQGGKTKCKVSLINHA